MAGLGAGLHTCHVNGLVRYPSTQLTSYSTIVFRSRFLMIYVVCVHFIMLYKYDVCHSYSCNCIFIFYTSLLLILVLSV